MEDDEAVNLRKNPIYFIFSFQITKAKHDQVSSRKNNQGKQNFTKLHSNLQ